MTPEQFTLWFQGFAELTPNPPDARQWDQIREKLSQISSVDHSVVEVRPLQIEIDRKGLQAICDDFAKRMKRNAARIA